MYKIEDLKRDFEEGRLTEFVVKEFILDSKCDQDLNTNNYTQQCKKLPIYEINTKWSTLCFSFYDGVDFKSVDLEATQKLVKGDGEMKFKKEDLSTRHVVKLREGLICFIGERIKGGSKSLVTCSKSSFGDYCGISNLDNLNAELNHQFSCYDIIAIKEYNSTSKAYYAVLNDKVEKWDWKRKEKTKSQIEYEQMQNDLKLLQVKMDKFAEDNKLV